jgi:hypothetical protein
VRLHKTSHPTAQDRNDLIRRRTETLLSIVEVALRALAPRPACCRTLAPFRESWKRLTSQARQLRKRLASERPFDDPSVLISAHAIPVAVDFGLAILAIAGVRFAGDPSWRRLGRNGRLLEAFWLVSTGIESVARRDLTEGDSLPGDSLPGESL